MTGLSIRRGDSIMIREVGDEIVVLDIATNQVHQLNATASFIWRLCVEGAPAEDMAVRLSEAFDIDEETARRDTSTLVADLRRLRLLE